MQLVDFRITRFQFARDRIIGDSQVCADAVHLATIELFGEDGCTGLGFLQSLFHPLPAEKEIERIFREECWPSIAGRHVEAIAHAVRRPRGGNVRTMTLPFEEALQHAVWDLFAKSARMPLWKLLGAERRDIQVYASGLDFHLSDEEFEQLFVNTALALPEVEWLEYSFQNFEHLVEQPYVIREGRIWGSEQPGHGLVVSELARRSWRRPEVLARDELGRIPQQQRLLSVAR